MRNYDLTVIVDARLDKDALDRALAKVKKVIEDAGGKIGKIDEWGKKELAYPIKKQKQGIFYNSVVELDAKNIKAVQDKLKIEDTILRYLLVRKE